MLRPQPPSHDLKVAYTGVEARFSSGWGGGGVNHWYPETLGLSS